jgi:hypothetical protein
MGAELTGRERASKDGFVPDYVPLAARVALSGARSLGGELTR